MSMGPDRRGGKTKLVGYTVYADVLLALNFFLDFFLL